MESRRISQSGGSGDGIHLHCQVGAGGYSTVYRATLYGRVVAAKQLLVGTATDKVVRRLQHEAYVMSLTSHPNIVPFYGGAPPTAALVSSPGAASASSSAGYVNTCWQLPAQVMAASGCR